MKAPRAAKQPPTLRPGATVVREHAFVRHLRWGALVLLVVAGSAAAQSNLASALDGAGVEKASSALDKSFRAENLLDGDAGTTWATGRGKLEDQYVVIKLAVRRPVEIGAIAIDNTVAAGHPAEAA
ncbi:MAG: hypothetical protein FJX74_22825, partial [Armatimonadetes bacterium]|nr:hypothetical protein [Armatimonadota bacterium]